MSDNPDQDEFNRLWQEKIDEAVEGTRRAIVHHFSLESDYDHEIIREIVLDGIRLGVAINEDAARRAAIVVAGRRKN